MNIGHKIGMGPLSLYLGIVIGRDAPSYTVVKERQLGKPSRRGRPSVFNRPEFVAKFPDVKVKLERKELSFLQATQELDVSYATLKRALKKDAV